MPFEIFQGFCKENPAGLVPALVGIYQSACVQDPANKRRRVILSSTSPQQENYYEDNDTTMAHEGSSRHENSLDNRDGECFRYVCVQEL